MTGRQLKLLHAIADYWRKEGQGPTPRNLLGSVAYSDIVSVQKALQSLASGGYIQPVGWRRDAVIHPAGSLSELTTKLEFLHAPIGEKPVNCRLTEPEQTLYQLIIAYAENHGIEPSAKYLAEKQGVHLALVKRMLYRMQIKGWVQTHSDGADTPVMAIVSRYVRCTLQGNKVRIHLSGGVVTLPKDDAAAMARGLEKCLNN